MICTNRFSRNYRSVIGVGVLLGIACWMAAAPAAHAQVTVVSLGDVSGGVTAEVIVPFLLNPATTETKVGDISATVGFDSSVATYLRTEKGFLLDGVNGKIHAELHENTAEPANSSVQVDVATEGQPRKALREGLVLTLVFKINKDAPVKTKMPLRFLKLSASTAESPPQPIEPLTGAPGSIEVLSPESVPFVSCFFFTH